MNCVMSSHAIRCLGETPLPLRVSETPPVNPPLRIVSLVYIRAPGLLTSNGVSTLACNKPYFHQYDPV